MCKTSLSRCCISVCHYSHYPFYARSRGVAGTWRRQDILLISLFLLTQQAPSQGLCTCCSCSQKSLPPSNSCSLTSLTSFAQGPSLREPFPGHPTHSSPGHSPGTSVPYPVHIYPRLHYFLTSHYIYIFFIDISLTWHVKTPWGQGLLYGPLTSVFPASGTVPSRELAFNKYWRKERREGVKEGGKEGERKEGRHLALPSPSPFQAIILGLFCLGHVFQQQHCCHLSTDNPLWWGSPCAL